MKKITEKILLQYLNKPISFNSKFFVDVSGLTVSIRRSAKNNLARIRFLYRNQVNHKKYSFTFGSYNKMSLQEARAKYLEIDSYVKDNNCLPGGVPVKTEPEEVKSEITLGQVYDEFFALKEKEWAPITIRRKLYIYSNYLEPIAKTPIADITSEFLIDYLKPHLDRGCVAVTKTAINELNMVMDYAEFKKIIPYNTVRKMNKFLPKVKRNHFPAFPVEQLEAKLPIFFRDLAQKNKQIFVAVLFIFFTLLRLNEAMSMKFSNIDFERKTATVKTKTLEAFTLPLTKQALAIIAYCKKNYKNDFLFLNSKSSVYQSGTFSYIFKSLGYQDEMSVHGIRSCGRQWLELLPEAKESLIELCLSHRVGNMVQQAYNRSDYVEARRPLMQAWCDFVSKCAGDSIKFIYEN